jgi:hydrogenase maturation protease
VAWRIIGCGTPMSGDDEAGLTVARDLNERGLKAEEHSRDGLALLECWRDGQPTILIDATSSGTQPGTILTVDGAQPIPIAHGWRCSTHHIGIAQALEFGRVLGRLPSRLIVYGIEGRQFSMGSPLSPEVAAACLQVADRIVRLVRSAEID